MVRNCLILIFVFVFQLSNAQSVSLGVGGNILISQTVHNKALGFDILDTNGDTLLVSAATSKLQPIYSLPLYVRFTSRKNWWIQLNYGFEYWRIDINGETRHTDHYINGRVNDKIEASWLAYQGTEFSNYQDYYTAFSQIYYNNELALTTRTFNSFDAMQYNKFSLGFGSSVLQKSKYKVVYGIGIDFITKSTSESYQGLVYDNEAIVKKYEFLKALPALKEFNLGPYAKLGLEKQNLRIGVDFHLSPRPVSSFFEESDPEAIYPNSNDGPTIQSVFNYGVHLNYTLFSQYLNERENQKKAKALDSEILGKYIEIPKLWRLGFTVNFINFHNSALMTPSDFEISDEKHEEINQTLKVNNDTYLPGVFIADDEVIDNVYLEKVIHDFFVNDEGNIDTNFISKTLFFGWGNLNTIIKSPKVTGFVTFSPFSNFSFEAGMGYQRHTMGLEVYEKEISTINNTVFENTRQLLYQETYHEASLNLTVNAIKKVTHTSRVGLQLGLNFNSWIPGRFRRESGGINDSDLLQDFHNYFVEGDNENEWNKNKNPLANKGVFSKEQYYNYHYAPGSGTGQKNSYHSDFSTHLFNTFDQRSFFEIRLGADYYIENWRFTLYGEKSIGNYAFLYDDLLTFGMAFSLYLN